MILPLRAGWAGLWGAALAASLSPPPVQLAFAIIAIGVIGMAHGAGDAGIVRREHQLPFLAAYGGVIVLCLLWWHGDSALALPGFLLASAIHFAHEDAPAASLAERLARGLGMIAVPAALHREAYGLILQQAGLTATAPHFLVPVIAIMGGICAAGLIAAGIIRRDLTLITGMLALLLLPPFVGFSMGFLILHALPQTRLRRDQLGCTTYTRYLQATWPVLIGALLLATVVVFMLLPAGHQTTQPLFAALAALAIPHMLVTPWFELRQQK